MKRTRVLYLEVADKIKEDIFFRKVSSRFDAAGKRIRRTVSSQQNHCPKGNRAAGNQDEYVEKEKWSWTTAQAMSIQSIIQSGKFYVDLEELPI